MTALVCFLFGWYVIFNRRWLWERFTGARNEERITLGVVVFVSSLLYWWFTL